MIKHKLIINGTYTIDSTVLTGFTLSETVNDGQDLMLGSTCAAKIEFSVRISDGVSIPKYGDRITLYESNGGDFTQRGVFYVETTKRVTDRVYKVTAYDSVSKLDKDITEWLQTVTFPISLYDLTNRAIQQCGLILANDSIPNGKYQVKAFKASGITARNICRWAGEISARFCHATADGKISFDWYTPAGIDIAYSKHECDIEHFYHGTELEVTGKCIKADYVGGNLSMDSNLFTQSYADGTLTTNYTDSVERLMYYMNSFKREAYQISPIEKVQIQATPSDIGTIFPNVSGEKNTYKITGNPLLSAENAESLKPIAEYVYNQLKTVTYTPINVVYPSDFRVKVGNTVNVISADGTSYSAYVMNRVESGSRDSISCSGNKVRSASTAVNNQSFKSLNGKMAEIKADVDGVSVRVEEVNQSAADNLKDFSDAVTKEFDDIRNQLDGVIDTWYGEEVPTASNFPAIDWVTPQDKEKHSGDLYYVVGTGPDSGNAYRWIFLNGSWYWDKLANSDIAKALEAAAQAQDTADHKRRVFVDTPYTPYDQGDLWAQGDTGELMRCNVSRQSGAYQASNWGPATDTGKKFAEFKVTTDAISASVTDLSDSTTSRFRQTADEISAKVSSSGGDVSSFAWQLKESGFFIVGNNKSLISATRNGLSVEGEIRAQSGKIGGWTINATKISSGGPGTNAKTAVVQAATPDITWVFAAGGNDHGGYADCPFRVNKEGDLYSTSAHITGEVNATSGKIGGLDVNSIGNMISAKVNSAGGSVSSFAWQLKESGFFVVANNKSLISATTEGLSIEGKVRALSGKIGGWEIGGQILGNGFVSGVADANRVGIAPGINPKTEAYQPRDGLCLWAGARWEKDSVNYENAPFRVYADGRIHASKGTFSGRIEAESGYFHGTVRAGKIEYGSVSGYVPKAGLDQNTRDELGYADFSNQVFNGVAQAQNIGTNVLRVVSNMFFRGGQIGVKRLAGQDVLVVLPKEASIEEAN